MSYNAVNTLILLAYAGWLMKAVINGATVRFHELSFHAGHNIDVIIEYHGQNAEY